MTATSQSPESSPALDALIVLAQREHRAGRLAEAAAACRKIIALLPDSAEAYNSLGNVLLEQGQLDEAAAQCVQALALKPSLFQAHNNLGNIFREQGKLEQALASFSRALAINPHHPDAHNDLGNVLMDQGRFDEAVAQYEQALALKPDLYQAHRNLGNARKAQGKLEQALAHYEQAIALRPDYAEAHYDRADLKIFRAGDPDLAALEAIAADASRLPPVKMLHIHFALAKALEDVGEHGRAFEHLLQGNALKRRDVQYHEADFQQTFRRITDLFDSTLLDRFGGVGDPSSVPIFIVGMPRSGSTLIEQILASHPQIHAGGELKNLDRVVSMVSDRDGRPVPFPEYIPSFDADGFQRLGRAYLANLPTLSDGKTRITDKAPSNFFLVGLIRLILPDARIIHTARDPVETCVSCFSRLFAQGQSFSYDLAELGRHYRRYYELMGHWRSILPAGTVLDVAYEDVVDNVEEQARRLIDYCGLPWDDRCLRFHETSRPIATASNVQVRRPLYRSSVARWRRYEAYLQPLLAELASCRE